ncbi:MAG: MFS transporter, partial [Bacteroidia bacterium]|nr:MFS transporter [Bacteroidia bacterium]
MKKFLTRNILILSFVSLFTDVAGEMLYPVMPIYLKEIGFSIMLIGLLEGVAEATAGLSKGFFGKWSDQSGRRLPFVQLGYLLSAVSKPLMVVFSFPLWVFGARTLDRLGKGMRTSARDAMLSDETTPEHKGQVFGFHRALDTFGAAIGPLVALAYLSFYPGDYKTLFTLAFIPGLLTIALSMIIREKKPVTAAAPIGKNKFFSYLGYWNRASAGYKTTVTALLLFTLFNSSDVFLLLLLKYKGFDDFSLLTV